MSSLTKDITVSSQSSFFWGHLTVNSLFQRCCALDVFQRIVHLIANLSYSTFNEVTSSTVFVVFVWGLHSLENCINRVVSKKNIWCWLWINYTRSIGHNVGSLDLQRTRRRKTLKFVNRLLDSNQFASYFSVIGVLYFYRFFACVIRSSISVYSVLHLLRDKLQSIRALNSHRAVDAGIGFAEAEQDDVRVSGDAQQSAVDTEMHAMNGKRTVVVFVATSLRFVEKLRRLQLVQHLQAHCTQPSVATNFSQWSSSSYSNNPQHHIYSATIYGAKPYAEITLGPLDESRWAPGGRQLVGQAANLTVGSACILL